MLITLILPISREVYAFDGYLRVESKILTWVGVIIEDVFFYDILFGLDNFGGLVRVRDWFDSPEPVSNGDEGKRPSCVCPKSARGREAS